jgi:hypothetical protein
MLAVMGPAGTRGIRLFKLPSVIKSLLEFDPVTLTLTTREGKHCEFKRDFISNDLSDYAKTLAGFANADGGVLVFGVSERPARIVGINELPDEAEWANRLREDFEPEILVSTRVYSVGSLRLLAVGVGQCENGPVICRKNRSRLVHTREGKTKDVEILREGAIYYRYAGQTRLISHSELTAVLIRREQQHIHGVLHTLKGMNQNDLKKISVLRTGPKRSAKRSTRSSREPGGQVVVSMRAAGRKSAQKEHQIYYVPEVRQNGSYDVNAAKSNYYVYTKQFDEVVRPHELGDGVDLDWRYRQLVDAMPPKGAYDKLTAQVYRRLTQTPSRVSLSVTLLLDNSGSMRNKSIIALAGTTLLLIDVLERLKIRTEVLGFTTRNWKGGQARELWLNDGKPPAPGRLNDLRHIIYKTFDEPISASSPGLGLMMREGLLKENIDGEALLWAYSRLVQERSRKKILFMFTDGAPKDDSTDSVQRDGFLRDDLVAVVEKIVAEKKVMLKLIGIKHDLSDVLFDAFRVTESELGDPVLKTIGNVLSPA